MRQRWPSSGFFLTHWHLLMISDQCVMVISFLDVWTAFECVDHYLMLQHLERNVGNGWCHSCLAGNSKSFIVTDCPQYIECTVGSLSVGAAVSDASTVIARLTQCIALLTLPATSEPSKNSLYLAWFDTASRQDQWLRCTLVVNDNVDSVQDLAVITDSHLTCKFHTAFCTSCVGSCSHCWLMQLSSPHIFLVALGLP